MVSPAFLDSQHPGLARLFGFSYLNQTRKPMTIQYFQRPHTGAAQSLLDAPDTPPADPSPLTTPALDLVYPDPGSRDEYIRHILIGSPQGVQGTIYLLQARHYVDHAQWSGPIAIGEAGVRITRQEGQVMAYLMRRRSLDIPPR